MSPDPAPAPARILIVDDEASTRRTLELILRKAGHATATATTGQEALQQARQHTLQVALVDIRLPDVQGTELIEQLREQHPETAVIIMTGYASVETAVHALNRNAAAYIRKPLNMDEVLAEIERCLAQQRLEAENRRLYQAAQRELAERKRLEREILRISEAEQRRIGQDLHDTLGQLLTGVLFALDELEDKLAAKDLPEAEDARKAIELLEQAGQQARGLARGLCPVIQEPDGLMAALEHLAATIEAQHRLTCRFECARPVLVHNNAAAIHLYRIAQEAVHNAVKHSRGKHIRLRLSTSDDHLTLAVEDDGVGIPDDLSESTGMGLHIMGYRTRVIGGRLEIRRNGEAGTAVICRLPLRQAVAPPEEHPDGP